MRHFAVQLGKILVYTKGVSMAHDFAAPHGDVDWEAIYAGWMRLARHVVAGCTEDERRQWQEWARQRQQAGAQAVRPGAIIRMGDQPGRRQRHPIVRPK